MMELDDSVEACSGERAGRRRHRRSITTGSPGPGISAMDELTVRASEALAQSLRPKRPAVERDRGRRRRAHDAAGVPAGRRCRDRVHRPRLRNVHREVLRLQGHEPLRVTDSPGGGRFLVPAFPVRSRGTPSRPGADRPAPVRSPPGRGRRARPAGPFASPSRRAPGSALAATSGTRRAEVNRDGRQVPDSAAGLLLAAGIGATQGAVGGCRTSTSRRWPPGSSRARALAAMLANGLIPTRMATLAPDGQLRAVCLVLPARSNRPSGRFSASSRPRIRRRPAASGRAITPTVAPRTATGRRRGAGHRAGDSAARRGRERLAQKVPALCPPTRHLPYPAVPLHRALGHVAFWLHGPGTGCWTRWTHGRGVGDGLPRARAGRPAGDRSDLSATAGRTAGIDRQRRS